MSLDFDLAPHGLHVPRVLRNASPAALYEAACQMVDGHVVSSGALAALSGEKTGRCPKDKRVVERPELTGNLWWGDVNIPLSPAAFAMNKQQAVDFLNSCPRLFVHDGYAGWDPRYRIKVRVICARPYHALFMQNMLIRPSAAELAGFGEPDYVIYNAGEFPANKFHPEGGSATAIGLDFGSREVVILGTQYAGEMKKGVFTILHYLMPRQDVLSMHCSANEGPAGDVALFFGLSGTGKTTLSADPSRRLIGDDEHCWSDRGVFNVEGGCYAKCVNLTAEQEPEIFQAIRFGSILENVVYDPDSRVVDFRDDSITENTRAAYPIEFIPNAKIPCVGGHPKNIIFLTCDASGVLPPVSKLSPSQAMYHFISGYTARVAGTEVGVTEPTVAFSACFSAAFLAWHPTRYAELLAKKLRDHQAQAWLVNTGWTGGAYGVGSRMKLARTRAIIDAIHSGQLLNCRSVEDPLFGFQVPTACPGVPDRLLQPQQTWADKDAYQKAAVKLASLFQANFKKFADAASEEIRASGPRLPVAAGA